MRNYQIEASILSANFARLGAEAQAVIAAGADILHFDAMDNHFVPNLTIGPLICAALRLDGIAAAINIHLMAKPVDNLIVDFAKAGASNITVHVEASAHIERSLMLIAEQGCGVGIAIKPQTPWHCLEPLLDKVNLILVMSVNPGFGGQTFIASSLDKIRQIRNLISSSGRNIRLVVDGGIKTHNIAQVAQAGADGFVIGTGIFKQPDYAGAISEMREVLTQV